MGSLTALTVLIVSCVQSSLAVGSAENNLSLKVFVKNSGESSQPPSSRDYASHRHRRNAYYESPDFNTGSVNVAAINNSLPESFDARQKWTYCPSLNVVRNQGCCGSSYAVSAVSTMTDRWCVQSEGTAQFNFGASDVMSCCLTCGFGCDGGVPSAVWQYWVENGITSGGPYGSQDGCQSYPFDICTNQGGIAVVPLCTRTCQPGYNTTYVEDKRFGRVAYAVPKDEASIMYELYNFGPVQTTFSVFTDFLQYKSGVYRHAFGVQFGTQSAKVLGWGVENGVKFWLCANSWGAEWGDGGFFKIVRGEDHLGVESDIVTGLPLFR